uniref:Uncharacterized protein n=1 Tax=Faecalibaculum rodentium TaxID=1702221 RepID=A0A140DSJ3_9FIRM|nr:hypothetical protein AALO17_04860 [Faecalibaculum rodentium]
MIKSSIPPYYTENLSETKERKRKVTPASAGDRQRADGLSG